MVTQLASYPTDRLSGRLRENARPATMHGHSANFKSHFGRGLPERPWAYPIDPAHTQRIDLMMMGLGSLGTSPWFHIYMFEDANPYSAAQANSALSHNAVVSKLSLIHI